VGGHAVAFHGYPRYTGDIDFFVEPTEENATRLMQALDRFGFGDVGIEQQDLVTPGKVIQLGFPPSRIDLVTSITGVIFAEAQASHVATDLDGLPVRILGRDALLKNKRAAGRAKDLADLEAIEGD
jgi:hypothetical protein